MIAFVLVATFTAAALLHARLAGRRSMKRQIAVVLGALVGAPERAHAAELIHELCIVRGHPPPTWVDSTSNASSRSAEACFGWGTVMVRVSQRGIHVRAHGDFHLRIDDGTAHDAATIVEACMRIAGEGTAR